MRTKIQSIEILKMMVALLSLNLRHSLSVPLKKYRTPGSINFGDDRIVFIYFNLDECTKKVPPPYVPGGGLTNQAATSATFWAAGRPRLIVPPAATRAACAASLA